MTTSKIHIGSLIKQKVDEKSLSIAKFARLISRSRSAVYHVYNCDSIDVELLRTISDVLDYDFIEIYYTKSSKNKLANTNTDHVMITFINETELPQSLPQNSILTKRK